MREKTIEDVKQDCRDYRKKCEKAGKAGRDDAVLSFNAAQAIGSLQSTIETLEREKAELVDVLQMVSDADDDAIEDGLPAMPRLAKARILDALAKHTEGESNEP